MGGIGRQVKTKGRDTARIRGQEGWKMKMRGHITVMDKEVGQPVSKSRKTQRHER